MFNVSLLNPRIHLPLLTSLLGLLIMPAAHAQFAVIDVGAITQLIQQVQTTQQQLTTANNQLTQAQSEFNSITGNRGMQSLLAGTNRNYLAPSWTQLPTTLATPIQTTVKGNAILTPAQVAVLSPAEQQQLSTARGNAALLQVTTQQAYATTSNRFVSLQQLINAIPSATDQKGILDLQARIQAEQGMLQNESTKLNVLYQAAQAQEWARQQRVREQGIADIGSFRHLPPMGL